MKSYRTDCIHEAVRCLLDLSELAGSQCRVCQYLTRLWRPISSALQSDPGQSISGCKDGTGGVEASEVAQQQSQQQLAEARSPEIASPLRLSPLEWQLELRSCWSPPRQPHRCSAQDDCFTSTAAEAAASLQCKAQSSGFRDACEQAGSQGLQDLKPALPKPR